MPESAQEGRPRRGRPGVAGDGRRRDESRTRVMVDERADVEHVDRGRCVVSVCGSTLWHVAGGEQNIRE
jgi:hypothetical protein